MQLQSVKWSWNIHSSVVPRVIGIEVRQSMEEHSLIGVELAAPVGNLSAFKDWLILTCVATNLIQ